MKLYYHHVGKRGAAEDFKKTVFARVPISLIETSLPDAEPAKLTLVNDLYEKFSVGSFNCWGVPGGAAVVIRNLEPDDAVLLVESVSEFGGNIPAFGVVKTFIRQEFPTLSYALWGNSHFPYIFFFETEPLDLQWIDFIRDMDYSQKWNPYGKFLNVADDKLEKFGGAEKYLEYLRLKKPGQAISNDTSKKYLNESLKELSGEYRTAAETELNDILDDSNIGTPLLTDDNQREPVTVQTTPRDAAFSSQIKLIYGERCAVCGSNRYSTTGNPEVEGAHIYPKSLKGRDITQNGLSLCKLHHWAFDCGWFSIADDLSILVHPKIPRTAHYTFITDYEGKRIAIPENVKDHPHSVFLSAHRKLHGFD